VLASVQRAAVKGEDAQAAEQADLAGQAVCWG
jgi:hypothetical protein